MKTYHEPEHPNQANWLPGAEPGIDTSAEDDKIPPHLKHLNTQCDISIIDFSDTEAFHASADNKSLPDLLEEPRLDDLPCRWISVNGLSWDVIKCIGNKYGLHRLAIEDLLQTHSRTKVDWYADHAFCILTLQKLVRLHQHNDPRDCPAKEDLPSVPPASNGAWFPGLRDSKRKDVLPRYLDQNGDGKIDEFIKAHSGTSEQSPIKEIRTLHRYESAQIPEHTAYMEKNSTLASEDLVVSVEQVAIFLLADNTVISFFEHSAEDIEGPILERLQSTETMLRRSCDASLLLQAIIDAIVDLAIPVRDAYNKARKELQIDAMTHPDIKTSRSLHIFGEEIDMLQNLFKPIVHLVNALRDHNNEPGGIAHDIPPARGPPDHHDTPTQAQQHNAKAQKSPQEKPKLTPVDKVKRDRNGEPMFTRSISDLHRTPLKRSNTATTVTITPLAHTYFGDVLDHCITIIQALEQMDASANNISTLIFNTVGAKQNNLMMIFTLVTVFFSPLTFVSGYFGMNFAVSISTFVKYSERLLT